MRYRVLKRVKFDREYAIGEPIDSRDISPNMVNKLIQCKIIAEVAETEQVKPTENENKDITAEDSIIEKSEDETPKSKKTPKR